MYYVLSVDENKDNEYIKTVTEKAEAVVSRSQYTSLDNRLQQSREYRDASLLDVTGFGIVLLIFESMAMTAIIISAKLKTFIVYDVCGTNDATLDTFSYAVEKGIEIIIPDNTLKERNMILYQDRRSSRKAVV